jgi:hypothetical protein
MQFLIDTNNNFQNQSIFVFYRIYEKNIFKNRLYCVAAIFEFKNNKSFFDKMEPILENIGSIFAFYRIGGLLEFLKKNSFIKCNFKILTKRNFEIFESGKRHFKFLFFSFFIS